MIIKPKKVLHIVYAMNTGGVESWLMSIYRQLDREKIQFDFLVNIKDEAFFDSEIKKMGGQIIYVGKLKKPIEIYNNACLALKSEIYSAVHCHNVENATPVLKAAADNNISVRIYHSHNDLNKKLLLLPFFKRIYLKVSRLFALQYANRFLAVSKIAGDSLFKNNDYQVLSLGIDVEKFSPIQKKSLSKDDFGLAEEDFVVGHVGRFDYQKNHTFFLDIAKELIKLNPRTKFILIGNGVLEEEIKYKVKESGLDNFFVFTGVRNDVPQVLSQVMDAFLFPSLFEGLGLVIVEAQAAGLPIVCSKEIPDEAIVDTRLVQKIDLLVEANIWANALLRMYEQHKEHDKYSAYQNIARSKLNLNKSISNLEDIWNKKK